MTDRIGPFDTANFTQDSWYRSAKLWAPSGVFGSPVSSASSGGLAMTTSGLAVTIGVGTGLSRGALFDRDAAATVPGGTLNGNASLYRRDRIVLRRDLAAKTCTPVWLTGTPSATPTAPAVTQVDTGVWDTLLFSFLVPPNNGTTITGIIDERPWIDPDGGPRGLVPNGHGESGALISTSGTAEQRLSGTQNIACTLAAGRTYEVVACGHVESSGAAGGAILALKLRAAQGTTPTTSSKAVAGGQPFVPTSSAAGAVGFVIRGEFQVGTPGDWQIHLFGAVLSVASSLSVFPDARGVHSVSIYDRGPAQTSVLSI